MQNNQSNDIEQMQIDDLDQIEMQPNLLSEGSGMPQNLSSDQEKMRQNTTCWAQGAKKKVFGILSFMFLISFIWGVVHINMHPLDSYNQQRQTNTRDPNYVPEDWVIEDYEPQEIYLPDNVKITFVEKNIQIIPHYCDEHTLTLKIINYLGDKKSMAITINNIPETKAVIHINSDYETQNVTFPTMKFEKMQYSNQTRIPKVVVQTYETRNVTRKKYLSVRSIIDHNPNFRYQFFDSKTRLEFLNKHFNKTVVDAFQKLVPGTYKADFFRFSYLYVYGGMYIDCKMLAAQSYDKLLDTGYDMIFAMDLGDGTFYSTGFMVAVAGVEPLQKLIDLLIYNVHNKVYGRNSLDPTGPGALYHAVSPYVSKDPNSRFKINVIQLTQSDQPGFYLKWSEKNFGVLAYFHYPNYYNENGYRAKNYNYYYNSRTIYLP